MSSQARRPKNEGKERRQTAQPAGGGGAQIANTNPGDAARPAHERHSIIARAAYFLAEKRGFQPGHELQDWLTAEAECELMQQLVSSAAQSFRGRHEDR
jgi:hypothetical protein